MPRFRHSPASGRPPSSRVVALRISWTRLRRSEQALARLLKHRALSDTRDWQRERRARTRHLIELGGLVQKAGLASLLVADRAPLLGALLEVADRLRGFGRHDERPADLKAIWRRRGLRTFDAETAQAEVTDQGGQTEKESLRRA